MTFKIKSANRDKAALPTFYFTQVASINKLITILNQSQHRGILLPRLYVVKMAEKQKNSENMDHFRTNLCSTKQSQQNEFGIFRKLNTFLIRLTRHKNVNILKRVKTTETKIAL